jgi:hypothetical protein
MIQNPTGKFDELLSLAYPVLEYASNNYPEKLNEYYSLEPPQVLRFILDFDKSLQSVSTTDPAMLYENFLISKPAMKALLKPGIEYFQCKQRMAQPPDPTKANIQYAAPPEQIDLVYSLTYVAAVQLAQKFTCISNTNLAKTRTSAQVSARSSSTTNKSSRGETFFRIKPKRDNRFKGSCNMHRNVSLKLNRWLAKFKDPPLLGLSNA